MNPNESPQGLPQQTPSVPGQPASGQNGPNTPGAPDTRQRTTDPGFGIGQGYLRVRVYTGDEAIPLEGALVVISDFRGDCEEIPDNEGGVIANYLTDSDGLIPLITLPAPARQLSEQPGGILPYARYNLDVSLAGYTANHFLDVPIFDTIESLQSVPMIPLTDSGRTDRNSRESSYFNGESPNL